MSDKQKIIDDLRKNFGYMMNIQKATAALGYKDRAAAVKFLEGLPYVKMGKEKKYLASDIGKRIYDMMEF